MDNGLQHFIAGSTGGTLAATITCPLEVVKTRLQSKQVLQPGMPAVARRSIPTHFRNIVQREGFRGLYRGLGPTLIGVAPSRGIYFATYDFAKSSIGPLSISAPLTHLSSAMCAGFVTCTVNNPIWLLKTRMQLQTETDMAAVTRNVSMRNYNGIRDVIVRVYREEGIAGFYKGLTASYWGIAEGALQFTLYEELKSLAREYKTGEEITPLDNAAMAAVAKFTACVATYPHEVVRTRLREQRACLPGEFPKYRSMWQAIGLIAREEGRMGLYGGMGIHLLRTVPNAMVMFATYELIVKYT